MVRQLTEIPTDILVDIFSRLPAKSVACIKCVSKTLLYMVDNISFSTRHTRSLFNSAAYEVPPRLMCCSRDADLVTLQPLTYDYNALKKGTHAITVSSVPFTNCTVSFVFGNLFGLCTLEGRCMLVNALGDDKGILWLPEGGFSEQYLDRNVQRRFLYGMGIDDKTNTYKVVCVTSDKDARTFKPKSIATHVLVLGTNSWRQISSIPPSQLGLFDRRPVCANGGLHWWSIEPIYRKDRRLMSFDLSSEEFHWTPTPNRFSDSDIHLFSLRGSLAIVETRRNSSLMEIWVMKSFVENKWVNYCYKSYNDEIPYDFTSKGDVGEWEHGIFFIIEDEICFVDIRYGRAIKCINRIKYTSYEVKSYEYTGIFGGSHYYICHTTLLGMCSFSETLISLKHYGALEKDRYQWIDHLKTTY